MKTIAALLIFISLFFQNGLAAEDEYIDNSVYDNPTQPQVRFSHDDHNEMAGLEDCSLCHHLYENGVLVESESSEDMPCSDCHRPKLFDEKTTLTTAFHNRCKGCHLKVKKGPVICGECHKKNR